MGRSWIGGLLRILVAHPSYGRKDTRCPRSGINAGYRFMLRTREHAASTSGNRRLRRKTSTASTGGSLSRGVVHAADQRSDRHVQRGRPIGAGSVWSLLVVQA